MCWPDPSPEEDIPMRSRGITLAVVAALLLGVAGCGTNSNSTDGQSNSYTNAGIRLYGTDGNMSNSFGAVFKTAGAINGMVGTAPLTPIPDDFKHRLQAVDPALTDYNYAGETYDAVMITALAAQLAHSTDPPTIAKYINGVTVLSPGGVVCTAIKDCLAAVAAGKRIAYRGVSVHGGFTDAGEPATTTYGTLHFGRNNKLDDGKTEFVSAGNDNNATKQASPAPVPATTKYHGDALRLGLLLPKSGALALMGPPMFAGGHLAVNEVNGAGGILGKPVESSDGDDGTDVAKASSTFDKFVTDGIGVIIGPATSGESAALIPKAIAANRVLFSPSATSATLSTIDDHGLFFRTSPPDSYQSQALADVIMRGGARRVFIVARDDSYGTGLRDGVTADLAAAGIRPTEITSKTYQNGQKGFADIAAAVAAFKPNAVLVAGYDESANVIQAMLANGITFAQS
jgi:ABC-type branched-subunit amino acid transport system substrate-binding protein